MSKSATAIALFGIAILSSTARANDWDTTSLPRNFSYKLYLNAQGKTFCMGDTAVYRSTDDGLTWTRLGTHPYAKSIVASPTEALYISNDALGVFRSTDLGQHWSSSIVTEGCNSIASHPLGYLFAGLTYTGNGKVHRSTDAGNTWTGVPLPNSSGSFATECFAFGDNNEVYAGTIDGFYRSTDFGVSWTQYNNGLLGRHVRVITVASNQDVFIQTNYSTSSDGLYRSTDRGQTWQRIGGSNPYFTSLTSANNGVLYGTDGTSAYSSTDQGVTWTSVSFELGTSASLVSVVVTPGGRILIGGRYVYRSRTTATSTNETTALPTSFSLMQNYPNPFNPTTKIVYEVGSREFVELNVFDILGCEVKALVNEVKASGKYSVTLDASNLGSGVYFYRLRAGKFVETRKLVLMR